MSKITEILITTLTVLFPLSLISVCWRYTRTPSLPSWLSPHRDVTGDRIMHFSWGCEYKCAHCLSSVWAMFCSVNTYSFLWFDCLFLERQTSLVNNHEIFSVRCHSIIAILSFFLLKIRLLYSYTYCIHRVSKHFHLRRWSDPNNLCE